jgi:hypothetical protein
VGNSTRLRSTVAVLTGVLAVLAAACDQGAPARPARTQHPTASASTRPVARPAGPHGGVDLKVLVVTDGTPAVTAIRQQLAAEGVPVTVVDLRDSARRAITGAFLARTRPRGVAAEGTAGVAAGGNFNGIVLPGGDPPGLSGTEETVLARYESRFRVRQVDAYAPPQPDLGMSAPIYSGPLGGTAGVTKAGARAGFGYLKASFPFSGGAAGPPPFGYLARPLPGSGTSVTPLLTVSIPRSPRSGTLVWQYTHHRRLQLGIGFGYTYTLTQFRYLAPGIVDWVTRGVHLGYWRNYLDVGYDDVFNADAQWSSVGHCAPGSSVCPPGTPKTAPIRMTPADVTYAVQWQHGHHFTMEFLFNGGDSSRFRINGTDPLLTAFRPVARDFYWVNHTYTHANLGCEQDFRVVPWRCVTSGSRIVWARAAVINSQILDNLAWARANGIPAEPGVLATGEYSGLRILPQQPADNPYLVRALGPGRVRWLAMDASREHAMRRVGPALGVPRYPIDVGYDVATVADEVDQYNWFNTSKADGGSGLCRASTTTACIRPLDPKTGWTEQIVPGQVKIILAAVLNNDPRPFFLHQSNLTGDRLGYPVMDKVLAAYRAVYGASAPVVNLPMSGDGAALHQQALWTQTRRAGTVSAYVQGRTVTITGPPGTEVPVTVPAGTRAGSAAGPGFGRPYVGELSGSARLGAPPLTLILGRSVAYMDAQ